MLFLLVFIVAISGVRSEIDCEVRPECYYQNPISPEAHNEYEESGKTFPSNAFFRESCRPIIENVRCIRGHVEACEEVEDLNARAAFATLEEFCNENSTLRKGYVENVDCMNDINFEKQPCIFSTADSSRTIMENHLESLKQHGISRNCLALYVARPCAFEIMGESCGEGALAFMNEASSKVNDIFGCEESTPAVIVDLMNSLKLLRDVEELMNIL